MVDFYYILNRFPEILERPDEFYKRALDTGAIFPIALLCSVAGAWPHNINNRLVSFFPMKGSDIFSRLVQKSIIEGQGLPPVGEICYLLMMKSFRDRLNFLREILFPSRAVMEESFSGRNLYPYWLYYPYRIARLGARGMKVSRIVVSVLKR